MNVVIGCCFFISQAFGFNIDTLNYKTFIENLEKRNFEDVEKTILIAKEVERKLIAEKDSEYLMMLYEILSDLFIEQSDYRNSMPYLNILRNYYAKKLNYDGLARVLCKIGFIYTKLNIYLEALNYYEKAYYYSQKSKNDATIAFVNFHFGILNKEQGYYTQAYNYFDKAYHYYKSKNDYNKIVGTLLKMSDVLISVKNYKKAIGILKESEDFLTNIQDNKTKGDYFFYISKCFYFLKDYNKCLNYLNKAINFYKAHNITEGLIDVKILLGYVYLANNSLSEVNKIISECKEMINKVNNQKLKLKLYKLESEFLEKKGEYQNVVTLFKKMYALEDSIWTADKVKKMYDLEYIVNTKQLEREVEKMRLENQIILKKYKSEIVRRYVFILIIIILLFVFTVLILRYKSVKREKILIEEKNKQIEKAGEEILMLNNELENKVKERTLTLQKELEEKEKKIKTIEEIKRSLEQANSYKEAFLMNINHEIRTPLSAILGMNELLKEKFKDNKDVEILINGIHYNANKLLNILNNAIDFKRAESKEINVNIDEVNVSEIIENVIDIFKYKIYEKNLEINLDVDKNIIIKTDKNILTKIFYELLDNSIKHTTKGYIKISTLMLQSNNKIKIIIEDSGEGIDEELLPNIFDSFNVNKVDISKFQRGIGIGLPLVKRYLELLKGVIEIYSKKNVGTKVSIYLPIDTYNEKEQSLLSYEEIADEIEILIIEDDYFNGLFLKEVLQTIGKVELASNAFEALEKIRIKSKPFDVVIIDINLPDKWDGITLLNNINEKFPQYHNSIFIAQTAYVNYQNKDYYLENGFSAFFSKPIITSDLIKTIKILLLKKKKIKK
ncbi:MAG: ATP-binding protein [Bacteroidales bacterium]|nr:ATP-binding protein [Bacteroidales bacterium]